MNSEMTDHARRAVERYGYFVNILRSQADTALRRGGRDAADREGAVRVSQGAARSYLSVEGDFVTSDTLSVADEALARAHDELGVVRANLSDRMVEFVEESSQIMMRMIAAQAERDVMSLAQHIQLTAQRVDRYVRAGRHTTSSAVAAVLLEEDQAPAFRFIDRAGRRFKSSKHIRDTYRLHLLNVANEVFMDALADHGEQLVMVEHPEPTFKWQGQPLTLYADDEGTLFYDVRDEIFHPSSEARLARYRRP